MQQYLGQHSNCNTHQLIPLIFIILSLPSTLLFAFLTPPFQVPDAMDHYFYARSISLGQFLPRQIDGGQAGTGGPVRTTDQHLARIFNGVRFKPNVKVTDEMLANARRLSRGPIAVQNYWGSAVYPPTAYAIPAIALFIADHIGLNPLSAFYAGRSANALVYVLAGALAISLTPVGKFAFALVLLLPTSLSQAGSFSADANVFALSAIICAMLAREAARGPSSVSGLALCAALLVPLATTKPPMIALTLPLITIAWTRSRTLGVALGATVVLAFAFWTIEFVMTDAQSIRLATLPWDVSRSRQLTFLLSSPFSVIPIAVATLKTHWWNYIQGLIGMFGWNDTRLGIWFYGIALLCLIGTEVVTMTEKPIGHRFSFFTSAVIAAALTFGALYISWSAVGGNLVLGVQGRYFIPMMFPLTLSLAGLSRYGKLPSPVALTPILILWITSATYIPLVLVQRFYLH